MATATTSDVLTPNVAEILRADRNSAREHQCGCGTVFAVTGGGRHRIFYRRGAAKNDPIMLGLCPECGCRLPGK